MRKFLFARWTIVAVAGLVGAGCGKNQPFSPDLEQKTAGFRKPALRPVPVYGTVVAATVIRDRELASGVEVAFSRSISGRSADYAWRDTTDERGRVEVRITAEPEGSFERVGTTGYYRAVASDAMSREVVGTWGSIPINDGKTTELILEVGRRAMFRWDLRDRFDLQTLGPIPYPSDNPYGPRKVALGRLLFSDPILGGERDVACGTCHMAGRAFVDGRQFGAGVSGVGLGEDRTLSSSSISGDPISAEPRNVMTILNTAFNADEGGLPTPFGFFAVDGKARGLEELVTIPIDNQVEMRGDAYPEEVALDSVVARLRAIPEYVRLFEQAFPEMQTGDAAVVDGSTYSRALAAYARELVTRNSPYDRYVTGEEDALTDEQKSGLELFFTKAKCSACHTGPMFSDYRFIVQGVPQVGSGKGAGDDFGREEFTGDPADRYAFRTLTLRNVALTAPYMHDGVFETLDEVVRFYNDGAQPRHPLVTDDVMDPILVEPLGLSDAEIDAIVAFMEALTDPGTFLDPFLLTVPGQVPSGLTPLLGVRAAGEVAFDSGR